MKHPPAVLLALSLAATLCHAQKPFSITVHAGNQDRHQTPVFFRLTPEPGTKLGLWDSAGQFHKLQVDSQGNACFIQNNLRAGERANYKITRRSAQPQAEEERLANARSTSDGVVELTVGSRPVLRYQGTKSALPRDGIKEIFARGAYIHPVRTPKGVTLTDDYPHNHLHHHGIWWAWTKTEFEGRTPDFWNMGQGTGTVEFDAAPDQWSGPLHAGLRSHHRFVDLTGGQPKTVLNEDWELTAYWTSPDQEYWMFDLVSTQRCATGQPLKLPEYHYGGLGIRGHGQWDGAARCFFLTSEGETNRVKAHATRARWCDMSGGVDGRHAGVAVLGHPNNYRAPQPLRVHPTEPFLCFTPQQSGDMEIAPGQPYVSRYRFIVHDGGPDRARLDQFWHDYADPPNVEIQYQTD